MMSDEATETTTTPQSATTVLPLLLSTVGTHKEGFPGFGATITEVAETLRMDRDDVVATLMAHAPIGDAVQCDDLLVWWDGQRGQYVFSAIVQPTAEWEDAPENRIGYFTFGLRVQKSDAMDYVDSALAAQGMDWSALYTSRDQADGTVTVKALVAR